MTRLRGGPVSGRGVRQCCRENGTTLPGHRALCVGQGLGSPVAELSLSPQDGGDQSWQAGEGPVEREESWVLLGRGPNGGAGSRVGRSVRIDPSQCARKGQEQLPACLHQRSEQGTWRGQAHFSLWRLVSTNQTRQIEARNIIYHIKTKKELEEPREGSHVFLEQVSFQKAGHP